MTVAFFSDQVRWWECEGGCPPNVPLKVNWGAQKVPGSHLTPSGTLGGGLSGRWTVPTASGRATQDPRHGNRGLKPNLAVRRNE